MEASQQRDSKPVQVIPVSNAFLQTLTDKFKFKTSTTLSSDVTCMLSPHIAITTSPQQEYTTQRNTTTSTLHLHPLCIPSVSQILALQKTSILTTANTITTQQETKIEIQKEKQSVSLPEVTSKTTITVDTTQQSVPDVSASTTSSTVLALILLSQSQSVDETHRAEKFHQGYKCQIDGCKKEYFTIQNLVGHSIECHGMGSNTLSSKRSMEHTNTSPRPTKQQKVKIK